jgi:carbamoyltransferase
MHVLGINATFHDSSACLVRDGRVIAAAEEERFTRDKHHKRATPFNAHALPFHAIDFCLAQGGITLGEVDHVAYSFDPFMLVDGAVRPRFELPRDVAQARRGPLYDPWGTIFLAGVTAAPRMLVDDVPWHLQDRFAANGRGHAWAFHFLEHHVAHAASAFYPSPFERAAILTLDGRGECVSTYLGVGDGAQMEKLGEVELPHSLGLLYERLTSHLGFLNSSDEYKVMALASYGRPRFADRLRSLLRWREDGGYEIDWRPLEELVVPPRTPRSEFTEHHFDVAASLQLVLEDACLRLANWLRERTGEENLCLAGGVALNCVMNSRLQGETAFRRVWVQPAAGDAGTSLGAALWVWAQQQGGERWRMRDAYLGPEYDDDAIRAVLDHAGLTYRRCSDITAAAASLLAEGKVLGWFQGRMEFGPRALGARSILASPADPAMVQRLNLLKDREDFRPVAPAVLEEAAADYFERCEDSPFMLFVFLVKEEQQSRVPAIRHVDGTARAQTVSAADAPAFHRLISAFEDRTGLPMVVNTSFNTRSHPIVCTPQDALECFYTSPIDALAIGSYLLKK